ncbi:hypothetical protein PUR49_25900 [Streptomyces sp. BE147]|uniref:hypothetical protein n=1 Tax=Streptomyces sp. BE147 TaxID=3002524 RepID=UPI002E78228D|nr:hypothetical protein [Streptomyces sp. BE147]MEE1739912.1 hypothetical protein [Streptomyces sp. BE147]
MAKRRRYVRGGAAAGAAAVLLTGCGGGDGGGARAAALDRKQVESVLPDAAAVPGWRTHLEPGALKPDPEFPPSVCRVTEEKKADEICLGATSWGASAYARTSDRTSLNFWVLAYKDEKAAGTAYDALAKWYGGDRVGVGARKVDLGDLGDQRLANRADVGTMGGPATIAQVRVGTAVLGISTGTTGEDETSDRDLTAFSGMFAKRAQQAQDGGKPSAKLPSR